MNKLLDRFLNYVSLDTQSKTHVRQVPSTPGQWRLARQLCDELDILGLADITLSEQGVVMARLPSNASWPVPVLGFIAHLDTSPDFSGKQVNPQIIENYRGGDIALGIGDEILSPVVFPVLHHLTGHTLITTDGKTLLGADDKAGIAEIITAMARLRASEIPHGEIRIAFTPDEEVGKGMDGFDTCAFAVDWAYTVDGGDAGEFEIENFNAASALVRITGNQVHPGSAKGVMINALSLAMHFHQALPAEQVPEKTADREGFYHLHQMKGTAEKAELHYLIRDFCQVEFVRRKQYLQDSGAALRASLPSGCHVDVQITDSYFNMHDKIAAHPHIIDITLQAMEECGVKPKMTAIRGGTDGARLSFMGIPCPNLFTGGYNFHGKHEFISLQNMEHAVSVITGIATLTAEKARINQLIPQQ